MPIPAKFPPVTTLRARVIAMDASAGIAIVHVELVENWVRMQCCLHTDRKLHGNVRSLARCCIQWEHSVYNHRYNNVDLLFTLFHEQTQNKKERW
jgi:hypothetical protein